MCFGSSSSTKHTPPTTNTSQPSATIQPTNHIEHFKSENKIDKFRRVFHTKRKILLPVLHVLSVPHALSNAQTFHDHGVDGLFLINNYCSEETLLEAFRSVKLAFPEMWLGINILGRAVKMY